LRGGIAVSGIEVSEAALANLRGERGEEKRYLKRKGKKK